MTSHKAAAARYIQERDWETAEIISGRQSTVDDVLDREAILISIMATGWADQDPDPLPAWERETLLAEAIVSGDWMSAGL